MKQTKRTDIPKNWCGHDWGGMYSYWSCTKCYNRDYENIIPKREDVVSKSYVPIKCKKCKSDMEPLGT